MPTAKSTAASARPAPWRRCRCPSSGRCRMSIRLAFGTRRCEAFRAPPDQVGGLVWLRCAPRRPSGSGARMAPFAVLHTSTTHFRNGINKLRDPIAKGQVVAKWLKCRPDREWQLWRPQALPRWGVGVTDRPRPRLPRLYCTLAGTVVVLLPCGGDKGSQGADIERAMGYWRDWQRRSA